MLSESHENKVAQQTGHRTPDNEWLRSSPDPHRTVDNGASCFRWGGSETMQPSRTADTRRGQPDAVVSWSRFDNDASLTQRGASE